MNINDLTQGIDPNKLNSTLKQFSSMMSKDDINQVLNALKSTNPNELKQHINNISKNDLNQVLSSSPALKNALNSNPEVMKNLNSILNK